MREITGSLSSLATVIDVPEVELIVSDIERELQALGKYQSDRFQHMMKEIMKRMSFHKSNLLVKWQEQHDILNYQALKEIRAEFEMTHKKCRHMVSEWDRRKLSDLLSDHLMDTMTKSMMNT